MQKKGKNRNYRKLIERDRVLSDMHVHSCHSTDASIPIEAIVRCWNLSKVIPLVCDHNSIAGSVKVYQEIRGTDPDVPEILAEEILTSEGEIIGMFLQEEIPAFLTAEETLDRIREQGAISIVPHPFCSFRSSVMRPDVLDRVIDRIDIVEGFNGRAADERDNTYARRYAVLHKKPISAGSDAHTPEELGRTYTEMEPFDSPQGLLRSIRTAEIHYQKWPILSRFGRLIPEIPEKGRKRGYPCQSSI